MVYIKSMDPALSDCVFVCEAMSCGELDGVGDFSGDGVE